MDLISRKEAKAAGLKHYFTGDPCKYGHVNERLVSNRRCRYRSAVLALAQRNRDPQSWNARSLEWKRRNRRAVSRYARRWRSNNAPAVAAYMRRWKIDNPGRCTAHSVERRARKLGATPIWACKQAIVSVYAEADRRTRKTGVPHHVDHVIPLKHPLVCGLHVEFNLQAIPAVDNLRKHNSFAV